MARVATYLYLVALTLGLLLGMDRLTEPAAAELDASYPVARDVGARESTFVLLVDSLRHETGRDSAVMPNLAALRARATHARVIPSHDAVTVPSVRAAFTGRDRVTAFGLLRNVWKRPESLPSIFSRLDAAGGSAIVYSDGAFLQFGDAIAEHVAIDGASAGAIEREERHAEGALARLMAGEADLVVAHVLYGDRAAHQHGVGHAIYIESFARIDRLIGRLADAMPAGVNLVVMGDHGHDRRGHHSIGGDVATSVLFVGPGFVAARDLGTIPITAIESHVARCLDLAPVIESSPRPRGQLAFLVLVIHGGVLAGLWLLRLLAGPAPAALEWLAWLALAPLALDRWYPVGAVVGIALGVALLVDRSRRTGLGVVAVAAPVSALLLHQWGRLLVDLQPIIHRPLVPTVALFWLVIVALGAAVAIARGAECALLVLALPALLAYPTVLRYGFVGALTPALIAWAAFVIVGSRRHLAGSLSIVAPVVLLHPFLMAEAFDGRFVGWRTPFDVAWPHWLPLLGLVAGIVVAYRPGSGAVGRVAALLSVAVVIALQRGSAPTPVLLAIAVAAAVVALVIERAPASLQPAALRRAAAAVAMFLTLEAMFVSSAETRVWAACFVAALVLSARLVRRASATAAADWHHAFLLIAGVVAAGWITLAWSFHRLEWRFLFDLFESGFVDRNSAWFLPAVALRQALPLLGIRFLIRDELGPGHYPWRAVWLLAGIKLVAMLMVAIGIGGHALATDLYLEAIQEIAIWLVTVAALI